MTAKLPPSLERQRDERAYKHSPGYHDDDTINNPRYVSFQEGYNECFADVMNSPEVTALVEALDAIGYGKEQARSGSFGNSLFKCREYARTALIKFKEWSGK